MSDSLVFMAELARIFALTRSAMRIKTEVSQVAGATEKIMLDYPRLRECWKPIKTGSQSNVLASGVIDQTKLKPVVRGVQNPYFSLFYIFKGHCVYKDARAKEFNLGPGDVVLRRPGRVYSIERDFSSDWLEFFLNIPPVLYETLLKLNIFPRKQQTLQPGLHSLLTSRIENFLTLLIEEPYGTFAQSLSSAIQLIVDFTLFDARHSIPPPESVKIQEACRLLEELICDRSVKIEEIAREVGLCSDSFRRLFKTQIGISPKEYLLHKRIEHAQRLFFECGMDIKQVAFELNYPDLASFSKQFKQITGLPPGTFRDLH